MSAVGLLLERCAVLRLCLRRPIQRHEHVAEQLTRGSERTWRHCTFLGRVFTCYSLTHPRQRFSLALLGEIHPRLRGEVLNRHLLRPIGFFLRDQATLDRRE